VQRTKRRGYGRRRFRGRDGVLRRARTPVAGRGVGRGRLGGPRVPLTVGQARRPKLRRRTPWASASLRSSATTSTLPSPPSTPRPASSLASWSSTAKSSGSSTSVVWRGSSSSLPSRSAEDFRRRGAPRRGSRRRAHIRPRGPAAIWPTIQDPARGVLTALPSRQRRSVTRTSAQGAPHSSPAATRW